MYKYTRAGATLSEFKDRLAEVVLTREYAELLLQAVDAISTPKDKANAMMAVLGYVIPKLKNDDPPKIDAHQVVNLHYEVIDPQYFDPDALKEPEG